MAEPPPPASCAPNSAPPKCEHPHQSSSGRRVSCSPPRTWGSGNVQGTSATPISPLTLRAVVTVPGLGHQEQPLPGTRRQGAASPPDTDRHRWVHRRAGIPAPLASRPGDAPGLRELR